jgi:hypothetical protein
MHLHVVPRGPRSPFRSQRAYNNLLESILHAKPDSFVGFCLYVGLLGFKPTDMPVDEPVQMEAPLVSEPGGLLTGVVGPDIPVS